MRHLILLICSCVSLAFFSCHTIDSDEPEASGAFPYWLPAPMYNEIGTSGIYSYYFDTISKKFSVTENGKPFADSLTSYNHAEIYVDYKYDGKYWDEFVKDEQFDTIKKLSAQYCKEKIAFITEAFNNRNDKNLRWIPFSGRYLEGDVSITCDKALYGEYPGTNLVKYFEIIAEDHKWCIVSGIEDPQIVNGFDDWAPKQLSAYCSKGCWLVNGICLPAFRFIYAPSEKYSDITFTITVPILTENTYSYVAAKYLNKQIGQPYRHEVFTTQLTMYFKWD